MGWEFRVGLIFMKGFDLREKLYFKDGLNFGGVLIFWADWINHPS